MGRWHLFDRNCSSLHMTGSVWFPKVLVLGAVSLSQATKLRSEYAPVALIERS